MEETVYKIMLSDGTTLDNLKLNGNNYISKTSVTEDTFKGKLSTVTISNDLNYTEVHQNMELVQISIINDEYWFVLRDISEEELIKIKMQADLEYIAMMTGIEL